MDNFAATLQDTVRIFSHLTILALLGLFSYHLGSNLYFLNRSRRAAKRVRLPQPRVSVLVPARNEAATIAACVTSLLQQEYNNYELIVLNDGSTDNTGAQLDQLAEAHPHLKVIHASHSLPAGWNGKSYACHRLAQQATGEWLLFTDADTRHTPQSIAQGVAHALTLDVDLLSAFPAQETRTWSERIFVSFIIDFLPLIGLNFRAIYAGKGAHTASNGQYLLIRATAYHQSGGHAAIHHETLDDFALAKHFRLGGYKIALIDGQELLSCRMYRTVREVWEGFSRSLMHGLDNSTLHSHSLWWALLFAWGYGSIFVTPFYASFLPEYRYLALFEIAWLLLLRGVASWHLHRSPLEVLTTPLAAWGVMALALTALYRRRIGQKVNWKGRYYAG
jgi:chlorobactene glucosyltransferase